MKLLLIGTQLQNFWFTRFGMKAKEIAFLTSFQSMLLLLLLLFGDHTLRTTGLETQPLAPITLMVVPDYGWFFSFKGLANLHVMQVCARVECEILQLLSCFLDTWVNHQGM